jgi:hypothetical protein
LQIEAETREKLYERLPGAIEDLLGSGEREVEFIAKIAPLPPRGRTAASAHFK